MNHAVFNQPKILLTKSLHGKYVSSFISVYHIDQFYFSPEFHIFTIRFFSFFSRRSPPCFFCSALWSLLVLLFPTSLHARLLAIMHKLITILIMMLISMTMTPMKMIVMFYFSAFHALVDALVVPMHSWALSSPPPACDFCWFSSEYSALHCNISCLELLELHWSNHL